MKSGRSAGWLLLRGNHGGERAKRAIGCYVRKTLSKRRGSIYLTMVTCPHCDRGKLGASISPLENMHSNDFFSRSTELLSPLFCKADQRMKMYVNERKKKKGRAAASAPALSLPFPTLLRLHITLIIATTYASSVREAGA